MQHCWQGIARMPKISEQGGELTATMRPISRGGGEMKKKLSYSTISMRKKRW